jgi:hypothetical protein
MNNNQATSHRIYLSIFGCISEQADYIEPEDGYDFLLTETLIVSITATVITSFIGGACGELGKIIINNTKTRLFRNAEISQSEPADIINAIDRYLDARNTTLENIAEGERAAYQKLRDLGLPEEVAARVSKEISNSLRGNRNV